MNALKSFLYRKASRFFAWLASKPAACKKVGIALLKAVIMICERLQQRPADVGKTILTFLARYCAYKGEQYARPKNKSV